jgi:hypothetical protein
MTLRVFLLGVLLLFGAEAEAARAKKNAHRPPPAADGSCPAGMRRTIEGHCSRCAASHAKVRETCNESWNNCTEKCEAANEKCLSNPRALNCDAQNANCAQKCDKAKSGCYASAEKTYQSCRAKERK